jgi:hypothetical protein
MLGVIWQENHGEIWPALSSPVELGRLGSAGLSVKMFGGFMRRGLGFSVTLAAQRPSAELTLIQDQRLARQRQAST